MVGATLLVVVVRPTSIALSGLATLSFLLGAVLAVPAVLSPLARVLGRLTARLAPGVGPVAVLHLVKERSRSAYTLGLVMVVLALLLAVGASNLAMARTLDEVVDRQAGGNVQVYATNVFDPSVRDELAALDGVELVSALRFGSTDVSQVGGGERTRSFLVVIEPETYFDLAGFAWVDGSDAEARAALAAGGAILLPSGVAGTLGVERGDTVDVDGTAGVAPMTLAGTYAVLGPGFGAVVGVADGARFGVGRPNGFLLDVAGGGDAEAVAGAATQRLSDRYVVTVDTPKHVRDRATAQLQGFFAMGYAILGVAAVIGLLGLANTLVVSVLTRTRELGVLRSVGALRRQVRRMVLVEAGTLVLVALVLALPLGAVLAAALVTGQRASLGFTISYEYPWALVLPLSFAALVVTAVASLVPSRRAGRLEIVEALRFD
jgi:putative ABC transport system permease protein